MGNDVGLQQDLIMEKRKKSPRERLQGALRIRNQSVRECLAEFLGTFILVFMGDAAVAQSVLGGDLGTMMTSIFGGGISVAFGIYASAGVSGGHINPAVSLMLAVLGKMPWKKLPVYILGQMLGGFIACPVLYFNIRDELNKFDNGTRYVTGPLATANIFTTFPGSEISIGTCIYDGIITSAMLGVAVLALTDQRNQFAPGKNLFPMFLGFVITALLSGFAGNSMCILNPARDLSPRIFTLMAGWGLETFSIRNYMYFWIGIVVPPIGCILGGIIYQLFVEFHWSPEINQSVPTSINNTANEKGERDALLLKEKSENERLDEDNC